MKKMVKIQTLVNRPLYIFSEADRLANVSRGTSRRWLAGYDYTAKDKRVRQPPITPRTNATGAVSFTDLLEVVAIGRLKVFGFSLGQVRTIVRNCQRTLEVEHPLTTLRFKIGGREIFVERAYELLEVGRRRGIQAWSDFKQAILMSR